MSRIVQASSVFNSSSGTSGYRLPKSGARYRCMHSIPPPPAEVASGQLGTAWHLTDWARSMQPGDGGKRLCRFKTFTPNLALLNICDINRVTGKTLPYQSLPDFRRSHQLTCHLRSQTAASCFFRTTPILK